MLSKITEKTQFKAQYNDGVTAAAYPVEIILTGFGIQIEGKGSVPIAEWAWRDIQLAEKITHNRPIRILNRSILGARLTIEDPAVGEILRKNAGNLTRPPHPLKTKILLISVGILLTCTIGFATYGLPRLAGPLADMIPMHWEEGLGDQVISIVTDTLGPEAHYCTNPKGIAALRKLTYRLEKSIETPYSLKVRVLKSETVNAFAAPGGNVVLLSGLITKADTPEEVAGVLAHEIGHVIQRHPTKALIHAHGWSILISALTGFSGATGDLASGIALQLATSSYSRKNEADADSLATSILTKAGIDNAGFVTFFEKLKSEGMKKNTGIFRYFASHPTLQDRIDAIRSKSVPSYDPALSSAEWDALRAICG